MSIEEGTLQRRSTLKNIEENLFPEPKEGTGTRISQPEAPYIDVKIPLCHVLIKPVTKSESIIKSASHMSGHILICTGNYNIFRFICTLR